MLIDCDECVLRHTDACDDCIVTHLLDRSDGAVVFDLAEQRALKVLSEGGLTPASRYRPASGER